MTIAVAALPHPKTVAKSPSECSAARMEFHAERSVHLQRLADTAESAALAVMDGPKNIGYDDYAASAAADHNRAMCTVIQVTLMLIKERAQQMATDSNKKKFSTPELAHIGNVTRELTAKGSYNANGEVMLPASPEQICEAVFVDESSLGESNASAVTGAASYAIVNRGSFAAVPFLGLDPSATIVHNFANERHPGGGFLWGATAQEECLCRESTLYSSLASEAAKPYYKANEHDWNDTTNCNMLYSPSVVVFRNPDYSFRTEPYIVSVATLAAPDRRGPAAGASQAELESALRRRLALLLDYASQQGKRSIVLGAWGCGAFLHDPRMVAKITRELLVDEGREKNFDNIVFAIIGAPSVNYDVFEDVFADRLSPSA